MTDEKSERIKEKRIEGGREGIWESSPCSMQ